MNRRVLAATAILFVACMVLVFLLVGGLHGLERYRELFEFYANGKAIAQYVQDAGPYGPIVFIGLQALQVVAAPFPGEATGILGGYLFGTLPGLIYSTIGLTIGSCLGFALGRWLGLPFVRRFVKQETYHKFDFLTRAKGELMVFVLFLIPGFPKDILCYILGLSPIPFGIFLLVSAVGRIPGTWLLSMQGAQVRGQQYVGFVVLLSLIAAISLAVYLYRDQVLDWVRRHHHRRETKERRLTKEPKGQ
jgi:uncharacterized membrane protein YdjX (TVP38/TMEM64 family)